MTVELIEEIRVPGKRLGRHKDQRTDELRASGGPPPLADELRSVNHQTGPGMPLDQGDVGSCTGNALVGALNSRPHWPEGAPVLDESDAVDVYSVEEQDLFGEPYPPTDQGGSGHAVCEAAQQLGWCDNFQVAVGIEEALRALVLRPVITGVNWYTTFDSPPPNAVVSIGANATVRGGHEVVATEIRVPAGVTVENMGDHLDEILVGLWQSWGPGFGLHGRFFWSAATWARLLDEDGDVTVPRTAKGWVAGSAPVAEPVAPPEPTPVVEPTPVIPATPSWPQPMAPVPPAEPDPSPVPPAEPEPVSLSDQEHESLIERIEQDVREAVHRIEEEL